MKRLLLFVALTVVVSGGCKKSMDKLEKQGYESGQPQGGANPQGGGGGGGGGFGAAQAVRGAVNRVVTAAELHDLHLFILNARGPLGRVPTYAETWAEISQPSGNPKLTAMIKDGTIVMVAMPQEEGLWAYGKEAPIQGGWVLTNSGPERVSAQDFASRFNGR